MQIPNTDPDPAWKFESGSKTLSAGVCLTGDETQNNSLPLLPGHISRFRRWWLLVGCGGSMEGGCGGSMAVHQAVKPAVPCSNPASLQPAGTCHSLPGASRVGMITAGWPLRGGRSKKNTNKMIRKRKSVAMVMDTGTYI